MPTKVTRRNTLYGFPNPLDGLQQEPIVQQRDPNTSDTAEIGTIWTNTLSNSFFILTSSVQGVNTWTSSSAGAATATSFTVNPGNLTVTAGNVNITAGNLNMAAGSSAALGSLSAGATTLGSTLHVTGNTTIGGTLGVTGAAIFSNNVTVDGTLTANGDFDLTSAGAIILTTTSNTNPAIELVANGGTSETIVIQATQGTSAGSVEMLSVAGGVTISGALASIDAVNIIATNSAGGINLDAGTAGIAMISSGGPVSVTTGTGSINIGTDSIAKTVSLGNLTGASGMVIDAGTNGILATSTGVISLLSAASLSLNSSAGVINVGNNAVAQGINIGTGAAARPIIIGNTTASTTLALNTPTGTNVVAANGISVTTAGRGVSLPGGLLVITGAGDPNTVVTAPVGSLYLNTTGSSTSNRAFINSDAGTTWVAVTTAS